MAEFLKRIPVPTIPGIKEPFDEFPVTFRLEDFGFNANKALTKGEWNRIGSYTVEAGMEYCLGRRFDGYIFIEMKHDATTFYGKVRFVATNPVETRKEVVWEGHTREMGDVADKSKKPVLPLCPPWITQDSKLIVEIDPDDSGKTLHFGNTKSAIDLTSRVVK